LYVNESLAEPPCSACAWESICAQKKGGDCRSTNHAVKLMLSMLWHSIYVNNAAGRDHQLATT